MKHCRFLPEYGCSAPGRRNLAYCIDCLAMSSMAHYRKAIMVMGEMTAKLMESYTAYKNLDAARSMSDKWAELLEIARPETFKRLIEDDDEPRGFMIGLVPMEEDKNPLVR